MRLHVLWCEACWEGFHTIFVTGQVQYTKWQKATASEKYRVCTHWVDRALCFFYVLPCYARFHIFPIKEWLNKGIVFFPFFLDTSMWWSCCAKLIHSLHSFVKPLQQSCSMLFLPLHLNSVPLPRMSSKTPSANSIAHARRTVQQLRIEASIERIKVPPSLHNPTACCNVYTWHTSSHVLKRFTLYHCRVWHNCKSHIFKMFQGFKCE